jgi:hypothetical protein
VPIHFSKVLALTAIATAFVAPVTPASAQGLFDFLFGDRRPHLPPQASSYANPLDLSYGGTPRKTIPVHTGPVYAYCVRLCDGHYFPIPPHAGVTAVQACRSFCPASKTKIFSGSGIDHAVAADGARYPDLVNAYVYRGELVPGCTCNGKDVFGLAPVDAASDPTLRAGDIVVTGAGPMVFRDRENREARFTPVDPSRLAKALR